jgi:UDP-N-acetylmuramoyl-L-alanyl-D-glutamate--2,6-diaminopimelate ligase
MNSAVATDADIAALLARLGTELRRITSDSRDVRNGDAFAAYPGTRHDGREFIADAITRGAGAVLWETHGFNWNHAWRIPHLPLEDLKAKVGAIADFIYGHPSRELWMVGVTGTNGKTSCAHWIATGLEASGRKSAVLGTLGNGLLGSLSPSSNTTPDAALLHETLAALKAAGAEVVAMEVSSHGLDQGRVNGVAFDVAMFPNLSRDHLDYHVTMGRTAQPRRSCWRGLACAWRSSMPMTCSTKPDRVGAPQRTQGADLRIRRCGHRRLAVDAITAARVPRRDSHGAKATSRPGSSAPSTLPICSAFSECFGQRRRIRCGDRFHSHVDAPPGRMQRSGGGRAPLVVVDYAHTPDALKRY